MNLLNLGISKCLGKGVIAIALLNRYGQTYSNLKVLDLVPSLSSFKAFFISSHLWLIHGITGAPNPSAPTARYVSNGVDEYGWF